MVELTVHYEDADGERAQASFTANEKDARLNQRGGGVWVPQEKYKTYIPKHRILGMEAQAISDGG